MRALVHCLTLTGLALLVACGRSEPPAEQAGADIALTVHKSPTCECCDDWLEHMDARGFVSEPNHPDNLYEVKQELGIAPEHASCHTAVTEDGYVFEGHVPAKLVQRFLTEPPEDSLGLAVPRMPLGSPGMEMGNRFEPYDVLLLKRDGSTEVYAHMGQYSDQF